MTTTEKAEREVSPKLGLILGRGSSRFHHHTEATNEVASSTEEVPKEEEEEKMQVRLQ